MVDFDIAPVKSSIIMCAGIGGGGGNAVKHMYKQGMADVTFVICNTDRQALEDSPVPIKIKLGERLTGGLGAGNKPERGRLAAEESLEQIKEMFVENETRMLFVTAGMGGGTGTGAAPVIAKAAKEMGILTVAIVSIPFKTEGRKRVNQAIEGIEEISKYVDSLLVIDNESINEIHGDLTLSDAFGRADDILATAAKSIADIITSHFKINVDFEDVKTVMKDSGVALMGSARGSGENRALEVAESAMSSPLLNHKDISGAQNVLLNITSGTREVTLREAYEITEYIQDRSGNNNATDLIWGAGQDESLGDDIRVTVIATGFGMESIPALRARYESKSTHIEEEPVNGGRQTVNLDDPERPTTNKKNHANGDFDIVFRDKHNNPDSTHSTKEGAAISIQLPPRQKHHEEDVTETVKPQVKHSPKNEDGVEIRQKLVAEGDPLTHDMSDEAINVPAWKRRGIQLDPILNSTGRGERETLLTDPVGPPTNTLDMFEND